MTVGGVDLHRHGPGRRDVDHGVQRRQEQHRRGGCSTLSPAGGDRLPPNFILQLVGFDMLRPRRSDIRQFSIDLQPRIDVLPEFFA